MSKPRAEDVETVLALEQGMQMGMSNALAMLLATGERVDTRHMIAALSAFFTASVAKILPAEAWEHVFATLRECIPEMEEYRKQWLGDRAAAPAPLVPPPADPNAN